MRAVKRWPLLVALLVVCTAASGCAMRKWVPQQAEQIREVFGQISVQEWT